MKNLPLVSLFLAACAVDDDKGNNLDDTLLTDVSDDDWREICEDYAGVSVDRVVQCDSFEVTLGATTVEDCVAGSSVYTNPSCEGTVADFRECGEYVPTDEEVCAFAFEYPAACERVVACIEESTPTTTGHTGHTGTP